MSEEAAADAPAEEAPKPRRRSRKRQEEPVETIAPAVEQVVQEAVERQPGEDPPEQHERRRSEGYSSETRLLSDGTKARFRDRGNRYGVETSFEFADEDRRPPAEVVEVFKEEHPGREREYWTENPEGERVWHKRVAGRGRGGRQLNPADERDDAKERFETAVERLEASMQDGKGTGTDGPAF